MAREENKTIIGWEDAFSCMKSQYHVPLSLCERETGKQSGAACGGGKKN